MKGLEVTFIVANELLFPFINDAPCLNELIIKESTLHNRDDIMIKVMEKEDDGKTINVLYSQTKTLSFYSTSWLKATGNFERFVSCISKLRQLEHVSLNNL